MLMEQAEVKKYSSSVASAEGLPIYYDLYVPKGADKPVPVIIFLHGFKGFKDWGAFPKACAELSAAGFAVLAMNFSLNGIGENMIDFDQLDLFSRETLSQDLDDVGIVLNALKSGDISAKGYELDTNAMGIIGHSRGGHTAVAAAAEYPDLGCLVTWSAVADYNARWSDKMIKDWNEKGVTEIKNSRTGQLMPIKDIVYHDALKNADRLMAVRRAKELNIPSLFIHAKGDDAVPFSEAKKLYQNCNARKKKLELIPDAGHTFDVSHPFDQEKFPEAFKHVLDATREWFAEHLCN